VPPPPGPHPGELTDDPGPAPQAPRLAARWPVRELTRLAAPGRMTRSHRGSSTSSTGRASRYAAARRQPPTSRSPRQALERGPKRGRHHRPQVQPQVVPRRRQREGQQRSRRAPP
jgi:hypothetical protein